VRGEKRHLVDGSEATRVVFLQNYYCKIFDRGTILELMTVSEKLVEIEAGVRARMGIVVERNIRGMKFLDIRFP